MNLKTRIVLLIGFGFVAIGTSHPNRLYAQEKTTCEDGKKSVVATGTVVRVMRDGNTGHVIFFDFQTGKGPASWKTINQKRWRRALLSEEVYGMMVENGDAGRLFKEGKRVLVRGCPGETYPPEILVSVRGISNAK